MTRHLLFSCSLGLAFVACAHQPPPPAGDARADSRPRGDQDIPTSVASSRDPFSADHVPATSEVGGGGNLPAAVVPEPEAVPAPTAALDDAQILDVARAANQGQIERAALARAHAQDPRVRRLADTIARDHAQLQRRSTEIAKSDDVRPKSSTDGDELRASSKTAIETLASLRGAAFDRAYLNAQVDEHDAVIRVIDDKLLPAVQRDDVKALVRAIRPSVQKHYVEAKALKDVLASR